MATRYLRFAAALTLLLPVFQSCSDNVTSPSGSLLADQVVWDIQRSSETYHSIWAAAPDNIFAIGLRETQLRTFGTILHYNGASWRTMSGTTPPLLGIWGRSASDIFAVGDEGTILHFNGSTWSKMPVGLSTPLFDL